MKWMEDTRDFWQQGNETSFSGGPAEGAAGGGSNGTFGWQGQSSFEQGPMEGTGPESSSIAFEGEQIPLGEGEDIWSLGSDAISWSQEEPAPYDAPAEEPVQEQFNPSLFGEAAPAEEPVQEQFNPSLFGEAAPAEEPAQEQFNPSLFGEAVPEEEPVQAAAPAPAPEPREQPQEEELPPDPNFDPFAAVSGGQKLNAGPFAAKAKKKPFGGSMTAEPTPAAAAPQPLERAPVAPVEEPPAAPAAPAAWPEVSPAEETPVAQPETTAAPAEEPVQEQFNPSLFEEAVPEQEPPVQAAAPAPAPEPREQPQEEELPPDPNFDPFAAVSGGQKLNAGPFVAKAKKKPFGGSVTAEPTPAAAEPQPLERAPAAPVEEPPAAPAAPVFRSAAATVEAASAAPAKTPAPVSVPQNRGPSGEGELPADPNFDPFANSFSNSLSFKAKVKKEPFAEPPKKTSFGDASRGAGATSVWGTQPAQEQPASSGEKKSGSGWPFAGEGGGTSSPWNRKPKTEPRNAGGSASPWGRQSGAATASFWGKKEVPQGPAGVVCPKCGTENPAEASFCCMCRSPLKERTCPACGRVVPVAQAKFCPFCGGDL